MIRVEGYSNLYRDEKTGAIINCDEIGYNQYKKSVESSKKQKRELDDMKKDIDEIKLLLKTLIETNNS
tara:strand:- start:1631 stop:1834 length:204 start_codon:yes stop_codon:yes gene_type:complete